MKNKNKFVTFVFLKEFFDVVIGVNVPSKDLIKDGKYPLISGGKTPMGRYNKFNQSKNTITVSKNGNGAGFVSWQTENFWLNNVCMALINKMPDKINSKFVYYYLKSIQSKIYSIVTPASPPSLRKTELENIKIPVPPLKKQNQVIWALDKFSMLTTKLASELAAELDLRKQQYQYYLDKIFKYETSAKIKILFDVVIGVNVPSKDLIKDGKYPLISGGKTPMGRYNKFNQSKNTITVSKNGNGAGFVSWQTENFWLNNVCMALINKMPDKINSKFVYYYLKSIQNQIYNIVTPAIPPSLRKTELENIEIPIPPLEKQNQIVNILDAFTTLIEDLEQSIPAEINLRQQQYEYYRNLLLTFKTEDEIDEI